MFCDEALEAVEPIAAGEVTPDGRIAAHLASCVNCAAALAGAQRVERLLRSRPVPVAPSHFTARTLARIRRARWRSEQFLDVGFNVAIGIIVVSAVGAIWMVLQRSGLTFVGGDAIDVVGAGVRTLVRRAAPSLPLYAAATALLATALGIWWWAERDATL